MPMVLRSHGLRVVIYPNEHRPAHVHVIGHGCEAVFKLNCPSGPVALRENLGFQRAELTRVATALGQRLAQACAAWSHLHGTD